jgi:hypothetical protein
MALLNGTQPNERQSDADAHSTRSRRDGKHTLD